LAGPQLPSLIFRVVLVVAVVCIVPAVAWAKAAEGWSQHQGGPARTGALTSGPAPAFRIAWQVAVDIGPLSEGFGLPTPVVAGDAVIVVGREEVVAVAVADGSERWRVPRASGPTVPPAVAVLPDGTSVVIASEGGGSGALASPTAPSATPSPSAPVSPVGEGPEAATATSVVALDAATGERVWSTPLGDVSRTGVTLTDDLAIVGADDGSVTALDPATGAKRWSVAVGGAVQLPIAATPDLVVVPVRPPDDPASGGGAALVAMATGDGAVRWRYLPELPQAEVLSPAIDVAAGVIYVALGDRTVVAIAASDGAERWSARTNQLGGLSSVIAGDLVLNVDQRGQVYAFDALSGTRRWDHALNAQILAPPVVVGDVLIVAGDQGGVDALELASGDVVFHTAVADGSGLAMSATDELLFISQAGSPGGLVALEHDPQGSLVRLRSPTILQPLTMAGSWLVAAIAIAAASLAFGRWAWPRLGEPSFPGDDMANAVEDPDA